MVGPGKLRDETDGKLRASLEGRPPGREPASHLPAGSPLSFVLWVLPWITLDFSKDHPEAAASQVQAVRLQDRR